MVDIDVDPPKPAEGHSFSRFLFPGHTPKHIFSHAFFICAARKLSAYAVFSHELSNLLKLSAGANFAGGI